MEKSFENALRAKRRTALPGILLAAAECAPLSKTGGLADVVGALPRELISLGFDARVITPYHRSAKDKYASQVEHICDFEISLGWRRQYVGLERLVLDGVTIYLIDNEFYFGARVYLGGEREGEQYCFFQRAVMECIPRLGFMPDVLHCSDWHTAMLPFLIKTQYDTTPLGAIKTVLTVHNLAYQGKFSLEFVQDMLGVDSVWYRPSAIEQDGCVNFLKAGCVFADRVTTVSPGYAREVLTPEYGEGLQGVLRCRGSEFSGILNGIDLTVFDPVRDGAIAARYSADDLSGKSQCRAALISEARLKDSDAPIVAMVTRMTPQKGLDLVLESFDRLMALGCSFVILGTGEQRYERFMHDAQQRYQGRVRAYLAYDEALAHRIYAGADFLLMPSAFEPCGLSQMIAMRYGTLPIVHETGGLADTVAPYNETDGSGCGFSFAGYDAETLLRVVGYALSACRREDVRLGLIRSAMERDFSFRSGAVQYGETFISVLDARGVSARHDPSRDRFRLPLGAVRCGERVRLFLETDSESAVLLADGAEHAMTPCPGGFEASLEAPADAHVVWYSFRLDSGAFYGADGVSSGSVVPFQMTVYDAGFATPDWAQGGVMYQIFPDRFRRGGNAFEKGAAYHRSLGRSIKVHEDWLEPVKWQGGEGYMPDDFYGGTLAGIEEALPRLHEAGVNIVYLNPIFESCSNHRYDTADYTRVDPMLGTNEDLERLCRRAAELGIRIVLDGVFSHTGDDSIYFNREGRYPGPGAYQGKTSPYWSWYDFRDFPDDYRCWWGFPNLPEVNETDPGWQEFMVSGENSIVRRWLRAGASGYRLDVADELPDGVIEGLRAAVKDEKPDGLIIGEVWEDATTKISYGSKRRYALGGALDSVMNYPLRGGIIDFVTGRAPAGKLCRLLVSQKLNYPAPMYRCLMNLMSSHDTARLRSVLALGGCDGAGLTREEQSRHELTPAQDAFARRRQRLCAAIQFALPGIACVYYGDEEGMTGLRDPFCRASYREGDGEMRETYASLACARRESEALRLGDAAFCAPDGDTLCILRFAPGDTRLAVINRSLRPREVKLLPSDFCGCESPALERLPEMPPLTVPECGYVLVKL